MTIHGQCSICGGRVCTPDVWHGVVAPSPTCDRCGATQKRKVIQMEPRRGASVFDIHELVWT